MMELLEGVEKVKESEKIMSTRDFQETGEKVKFQINSILIFYRKLQNIGINP